MRQILDAIEQVHRAFGAPGDYGYETAQGNALHALYLAAARTETADDKDAGRYRYLRERDLDTIEKGGVFAGMTPQNVVLNGEELDAAIDAALAAIAKAEGRS